MEKTQAIEQTEPSYMRQTDIINMDTLRRSRCTLVGAGAIGSFTAISLMKMGLGNLEVFDNDGVTAHNLPNQFYRNRDIDKFKSLALEEIVHDFVGTLIYANIKEYSGQVLRDTAIVATDTMTSRTLVWNEFLKQEQCHNYIEARMGAELGMVYTIQKAPIILENGKIREEYEVMIPDQDFYEATLYSDEQAVPLKCTARSIIYNVLMVSSLICRAYKGIINNEKAPREQIFDMEHLNKHSYMIRE